MTATPATQIEQSATPDLSFYDPARTAFAELNDYIPRRLTSDVDLVEEIGRYIVEAGGKRLRPLVVLLVSGACGVEGERRISLAAIIEFLHTATLLHDDVVDRSALRRGRRTANELWGNAPSVLVGDFLYSRAFQMMVELGDLRVMQILADATNVIAEGEVMQLAGVGELTMDEARYTEVIRCKTAMLFEAAAHTAAVIADADEQRARSMAAYGRDLGLCFQLVDDALDYAGEADRLGKNTGDDLAEGKMTLPLIHTLAHGDATQQDIVRTAVTERDAGRFEAVRGAVESAGSVAYTLARARERAASAQQHLAALPASSCRDALEALTDFAAARDH